MPERSVYEQALTLLGFRARSVAELRRTLLQKGAPTDEVERVLERLRDQKLLDDAEFARQFARNRLVGPGASRFRIIQELARRGVSRDLAERALDGLREEDGIDAADAIHRIARKKWASLARVDDVTRRRRLYAFLARRGFSPDEIAAAVRALGASDDA